MSSKNLESIRKNIPAQMTAEADILIGAALGKDRSFVLAHPEYVPGFWQRLKIGRYLHRLASGMPLAYIVKRREFCGLDFIVNKNVLIPRPETELLVETASELINKYSSGKTLLIDVGTGSGCVAVSLAKKTGKPVKIIATDISGRALRVARRNAGRHNVRIKFLRGDLLGPVKKYFSKAAKIDSVIITANLPYLAAAWFESEPSIQHEPQLALVADREKGLSLYEKLFRQAKTLLPAGCRAAIVVEIDPRQSAAMSDITKKYFPQAQIEIKKDLGGRDRVVIINAGFSS